MSNAFDSFLTFGDGVGTMTVETLLLRLLAALVLGQIVAWIYVGTHRGISYAASMSQALVVLPLIVALVMAVIGDSLARAFGLFGALALIRFRTPVKDARDTVFLFLAVALGIATGTGNVLIGAVGTLVIGAVLLQISLSGFGAKVSHDGLLRFQVAAGGEPAVRKVLDRHCAQVRLLHVREADPGTLDFSMEVQLDEDDRGPQLIDEVREVAGVSGVSLLMQDREAMP